MPARPFLRYAKCQPSAEAACAQLLHQLHHVWLCSTWDASTADEERQWQCWRQFQTNGTCHLQWNMPSACTASAHIPDGGSGAMRSFALLCFGTPNTPRAMLHMLVRALTAALLQAVVCACETAPGPRFEHPQHHHQACNSRECDPQVCLAASLLWSLNHHHLYCHSVF